MQIFNFRKILLTILAIILWLFLTGCCINNHLVHAAKQSLYVIDHSGILNDSDVNFINDINDEEMKRVTGHPHIYVYLTGSLIDVSRSQSGYDGGSAKDRSVVNSRKNNHKKYMIGEGALNKDDKIVYHSVRELRVKAHQKFTQLGLRDKF